MVGRKTLHFEAPCLAAIHTMPMLNGGQRKAVGSHTSVVPYNSNLLQTRNAGNSVLACGIACVAVGGCAQGIGQLFAALVMGIARNPSMKEDLFTYTLIGMGFLEFLALGCILIAFMLLYSE